MSRPTVRAGGGVLWRYDPAEPEVALVHRPAYDDWSLPKGKSEPGEHLLVTALREVAEETGYRARIGPFLTHVRYRVGARGHCARTRTGTTDKVVTYWSMRAVDGSFRASQEVDELLWLPVAEAHRQLSSASDRLVLETFSRIRRDTEPLLLVRHGTTATPPRRAKTRTGARRLNRSGRHQAAALIPVLAGLRVSDLVSADVPACVHMLAPFAAANGLDVRRDIGLTEAGFAGHERDVAAALRRDAASASALAVCGEQAVISGLLGALGRDAEVSPPRETALRKGGWWLLHHRDGAISAYERHEPAA